MTACISGWDTELIDRPVPSSNTVATASLAYARASEGHCYTLADGLTHQRCDLGR
ncbi:hypothetical protein [Streptomyces virginiae]